MFGTLAETACLSLAHNPFLQTTQFAAQPTPTIGMNAHRTASFRIPAAKEGNGPTEARNILAQDSSPKALGSGSLCSSYLSASLHWWAGTTTARAAWLVARSAFLAAFMTLLRTEDTAGIRLSWTRLLRFLGSSSASLVSRLSECLRGQRRPSSARGEAIETFPSMKMLKS